MSSPVDIVDLASADLRLREDAARVLLEAFEARGNSEWPGSIDAARAEVAECCAGDSICIGLASTAAEPGEAAASALMGWAGLRPLYDLVWELHPMAIRPAFQRSGHGRALLAAVEETARERGLIGIALGTDDEFGETSLSGRELDPSRLFADIASIENLGGHPFSFYEACGYSIVGVIPHANGFGKPDIWMWKDLRRFNERQ